MTDIIEYLRNAAKGYPLNERFTEAANEIERLRACLQEIRDDDFLGWLKPFWDDIDKALADPSDNRAEKDDG
jgi:hypothetical protein